MALPQSAETHPYSQRTIREKTGELAEHEVLHLTCFDQELVAGTEDAGLSLPLSNGRQIARGPDGAVYVLVESARRGLLLMGAAKPAPRSPCFAPPVVLVGLGEEGLFGRAEGSPGGGTLVMADWGRAVLLWHDARGVWLREGNAQGGVIEWLDQPSREPFIDSATIADAWLSPDGMVLRILYQSAEGLFHVFGATDESPRDRVGPVGARAVLAVDANGEAHVAFDLTESRPWQIGEYTGERATQTIWHTQTRGGAWSQPQQVTHSVTQHPSLVLWRGEPLIVFQTEGIKRVPPAGADYLHQREGGGSGVGFAMREGGRWRIGTIARPEEILVDENRSRDVFEGRIYSMVEEMHRPRLGIDRHGIPWAAWPDTTRRHTYAARWLGREFSQPQELRGGWYAPSPFVAVEREMPRGAEQLAMTTIAADRLYFTPAPVPAPRAEKGKRFLFLDLLEVEAIDGLEQAVGELRRYAGNPVLAPGPPGAWDDLQVFWPAIFEQDGGYLMVYQGAGTRLPGANTVMGVARSRDGIHWERPALGVFDIPGQPDNNCIPWIVFFRDDEEPDPRKRYKGAKSAGIWTKNLVRTAVYSPDGVHWTEAGPMSNMHCLHEACGPSFRDSFDVPERRFKAIGRTCCDEGRGAGMMWSADGLHWEGYEAFLDVHDPYGKPAAAWRGRYNAHRYLHPCGERRGQQIYWNTVWIEHGLYLCLYGPMRWDGGYDVALAVSRDGYRWTRVCGGAPLLEREPVGTRESGQIFIGYGNARPIRFGDTLRIYYAASPRHHGLDPYAQFEATGIGFAELGADRWACLRLRRERREGSLTTIPVTLPAGRWRLVLNGEGLGAFEGKPAVTVDVLDGQSRAVAASGLPDADEGVSVPMMLPNGALAGSRGVRLRFNVRSPWARLYAFGFEPV